MLFVLIIKLTSLIIFYNDFQCLYFCARILNVWPWTLNENTTDVFMYFGNMVTLYYILDFIFDQRQHSTVMQNNIVNVNFIIFAQV